MISSIGQRPDGVGRRSLPAHRLPAMPEAIRTTPIAA